MSSTSTTNSSIEYRPDIDGLRAIAVISILIFHAFPTLMPGGFIGVDIFFVISGFLISTIIYRGLEQRTFNFSTFYARRIKRIFPALLLVLGACYVFGWFALYADEYQQLSKHITGGASFISNFVLQSESGYFDVSAEIKPLLHLWSLGIEEQFYIIWPLTLWLAWRMKANLLAITAIALVISFALNMHSIHTDPVKTFFSPQTRAWELMIGAVLAYIMMSANTLEPNRHLKIFSIGSKITSGAPAILDNVKSVTGIGLLLLGFFFITKHGFPGLQAVIPCVGAALIISAKPSTWINKHILSNKPLVWLGLISYPLYLWHWPLLSFARIIESGVPSIEARITIVLLSIVLAGATYHFIELPLRKINWSLKTFFLIMLMITVGLIGYITFRNDGISDRSAVKNAKAANSQFIATTEWKYATNETCLTRYPFPGADDLPWWFCYINHDKNPSIILLGTSYANHLYPGIIKSAPNETVLSIGTCDPTYSITGYYPQRPCSLDSPQRQAEFINKIIETSGTVKLVIIDGLSLSVDDEYIRRLKERVSKIQKSGAQVVIFIPHITVDYNIKGCFSRPLKSPSKDCFISNEEKEKKLQQFKALIDNFTKTGNKALFFNQNETFCTADGCHLKIDGMPVFRDEYSHYSEYASNQVGKQFSDWASINGVDLK